MKTLLLAALLAAAGCSKAPSPAAADRPKPKLDAKGESPVSARVESKRRANRLLNETSPYLQQHAYNPVDWYPWGEEALAKAREENKPIFLSIGYSACHWCHVMERESFEDEGIAALLNAHFVPIKVDREERPDLDEIYMTAVQVTTGRGGWPMSVFLTPEGKPFFAGTYFPPEDRHGMPGFKTVLLRLKELWETRRDELRNHSEEIAKFVAQATTVEPKSGELATPILDRAVAELRAIFDARHGGFGEAPKFPPSMALELLLRRWRATGDQNLLSMVETTLDAMGRGGMYDHLGGGFHRYSTDERWLVPHFEKMLYDNALLARVYLAAFQATGKEVYRRVVVETLDYVLREMTRPGGGFYSTQDADSEGEEGKFFVWTPAEIEALLETEDARLFERAYGVTAAGNFEHGRSILHLPLSIADLAVVLERDAADLEKRLAGARAKLFEAREKRLKPHRDEKVIAAWNGLMLSAMSRAAAVLGEKRYLEAARQTADFLLRTMRTKEGRLLHSLRDGRARYEAYLDDYTALAEGFLDLYEATFDARWFTAARELAAKAVDLFWDAEAGGFFFTAKDHEELIARTKNLYDNAVPSGNSHAAHVLLRLAAWTGEEDYRRKAEATLQAFRALLERTAQGFAYMLGALDLYLDPPREVALVGKRDDETLGALLRAVHATFDPNRVLALLDPSSPDAKVLEETIPLLEGKTQVDGKPAAYVCRNFACRAPVTDPEALAKELAP